MTRQIIYPELAVDNVGFTTVGANSVAEAIDEGVSTRDYFGTHVYSHNYFQPYLLLDMTENQVAPSSAIFRLAYQYTPSPNGLDSSKIELLAYSVYIRDNISGGLLASGAPYKMIPDYSQIEEQTLCVVAPSSLLYDNVRCEIIFDTGLYYRDNTNPAGIWASPPLTNTRPCPSLVLDALEVEIIGGSFLPLNNEMSLFMPGPCNDRGYLRPFDTVIESSGFTTLSLDENDWALKSLRFAIPNSGNSFLTESGYATTAQAAFYGRSQDGYGVEINDRMVDRVDFWTNYSSGSILVSGVQPAPFAVNIPFSGMAGDTAVFSNAAWPDVRVAVDSGRQIGDFTFDFSSLETSMPTTFHLTSMTPRGVLNISYGGIIENSGTPLREIAAIRGWEQLSLNEVLETIEPSGLMEEPPYRPRAIFTNAINEKIYFVDHLNNSGDYRDVIRICNFDGSDVETLAGPFTDTVEDIDADYERDRLYLATVSGLSYIDLYASSQPTFLHSYSGAWTINYWGENKFFLARSGGMRKLDESGGVFTATDFNSFDGFFNHKIRFANSYFSSGTQRRALFLSNPYGYFDLFGVHVDTNTIGSFGVSSGLATSPGGIELDEHNHNLYVCDSGANELLIYTLGTNAPWVSNKAVLHGGLDGILDCSIHRNKQYYSNSMFYMDMTPLGTCCPTAPSGFFQATAGYSGSMDVYHERFGLITAEIFSSGNNLTWEAKGKRPGLVRAYPDYTTIGYHDYEISEDDNSSSLWRNGRIRMNIHGMAIPELNPFGETVSPTGYYSVAGLEYVYEDCYQLEDSNSLDLFTQAGQKSNDLDLYLTSFADEDVETTLHTKAAAPDKQATLFIDGFYDVSSGIMPLFLLGRDSGGIITDSINLFLDAVPSHSGEITLFLKHQPQESMILYINGTLPDSGSEETTLFLHGHSGNGNGMYAGFDLHIRGGLSEYMPLYITAPNGEDTANMPLVMTGLGTNHAVDLFVGNYFSSASGLPTLYLEGPEGIDVDDYMNLFIGNSGVDNGAGLMHHSMLLGRKYYDYILDLNDGVDMFIGGQSPNSNTMTLFMPSSIGSPSGFTTLYTHGF